MQTEIALCVDNACGHDGQEITLRSIEIKAYLSCLCSQHPWEILGHNFITLNYACSKQDFLRNLTQNGCSSSR